MKFAAFAFVFAVLPLAADAQVSKADIKKLAAAGVSEDVILTYIRANGGAPRMSADDLVDLKQAGVGDRVLASLAGATTSPAAPAPAPIERVVERPVYVPQTTYVYPAASSYWCGSHYAYDHCKPYYYRPYVAYAGWYPRYYNSWGVGYTRYWGGHCRPRTGVSVGIGWGW